MSPIDRVGLPYIQNYLKKSHICEKNILYIPLCDGVHFQGYVVDVLKKEIILIDSLRPAKGKKNQFRMLLQRLFLNRKKSDSNRTLRQEFSLTQTAAVYG